MQVRKNTKEYRKRQIRRRITLLVLLAAVLCAGLFWVYRFGPSFKKMDHKEYYQRLMEEPQDLSDTCLAMVMEERVDSRCAKIIDGSLYLPYDAVRENISTRFFWDGENREMLYTTASETIVYLPGETSYIEGGEERQTVCPVVQYLEDSLYLSADYLQTRANVKITPYEQDYHVVVSYDWGEKTSAVVRKKTSVRYSGDRRSPIISKVSKGTQVRLLSEPDEAGKWAKILTEEGYIGYVPVRTLNEAELIAVENEFTEETFPSLRMDEKVNLVWHMIGVAESNDYFKQDTADMTGVNVISPTWFSLSDNEGNFDSLADKSYVKKAHKKGLLVWGLVSNFSPDMSTSVLVESTAARLHLAQGLVDAAKEYGLDGINVDLEAIAQEAGYGYVQFVRELSVLCRAEGLYLSVDVPEPYDFNSHYDYAELGAYADYVIVMGYDEHYVGSEAGTVASLAFEENGIKKLIEKLPREKLVSGVPFYTRMWYSQTNADGSTSVWSEVLGMTAVSNTIETYQIEPVWDEETQQYYVEWTLDDGTVCRIWVEDETSLALKASLVQQYELGGIAAWALGNERSSVWEVITESIADAEE